MKKKSIIIISTVTVAILSIPLIAMQISDEWDWGVFDFIIIGALLFATGTAIDWALRNVSKKYQAIVVIGIVLACLTIWAEMAVGAVEQVITAIF